ncbi:MAG: hypothetical protein ACTMKV_07205, partial [Sphingomonas parapaucimobilis]
LMGWVNADGRWRFRSAWVETGKGQAKSPMMAGLGLYVMGWCGFPRSQVYSIAANKQTANVLFKDGTAMCRAQVPGYDDGDTLEALGHVVLRGEGDNTWKIEHPASQSFFLPLAGGSAQSGPRPRLVLADDGAGHQHARHLADRRHLLFGDGPADRQGREARRHPIRLRGARRQARSRNGFYQRGVLV